MICNSSTPYPTDIQLLCTNSTPLGRPVVPEV